MSSLVAPSPFLKGIHSGKKTNGSRKPIVSGEEVTNELFIEGEEELEDKQAATTGIFPHLEKEGFNSETAPRRHSLGGSDIRMTRRRSGVVGFTRERRASTSQLPVSAERYVQSDQEELYIRSLGRSHLFGRNIYDDMDVEHQQDPSFYFKEKEIGSKERRERQNSTQRRKDSIGVMMDSLNLFLDDAMNEFDSISESQRGTPNSVSQDVKDDIANEHVGAPSNDEWRPRRSFRNFQAAVKSVDSALSKAKSQFLKSDPHLTFSASGADDDFLADDSIREEDYNKILAEEMKLLKSLESRKEGRTELALILRMLLFNLFMNPILERYGEDEW